MVLEPQHAVEGDLEEPQPAIPHLGGALRIRQARDLLARLEGLWRERFGQIDALFRDSPDPE